MSFEEVSKEIDRSWSEFTGSEPVTFLTLCSRLQHYFTLNSLCTANSGITNASYCFKDIYINIVAQPSTGQSPCGTWVLLSESCYLFSDFVATWGEAIVRISLIETCWKQLMNSHIYSFIDYICFHSV